MNSSVIPMKNTRKRDNEDSPAKQRRDKKRDRTSTKSYEQERKAKRDGWDG